MGTDFSYYFTEPQKVREANQRITPLSISRKEKNDSNITNKKIIEKEKMPSEYKKSYEELQLLTELQQIIREEERRNIARDLHDELGQMLTSLKIDLKMLWKKFASAKMPDQATINAELSGIVKLVDRISTSVKTIASGLRPEILDELGIVGAIRWQCQEFETKNKIACKICLPPESLDFDPDFGIVLYRIVQEALTNVVRHAQATCVEIHLEIIDGTLVLNIKDNGKGISHEEVMSSRSLGIRGLRERVRFLNGKFEITGEQGKGTVISVTIPPKNQYSVEA